MVRAIGRDRARLVHFNLVCALMVSLLVLAGTSQAKRPPKIPAQFNDWARNPNNVGDFLRLIFIPAQYLYPLPDHLGRVPDKIRVFVGSTPYIVPPVTVSSAASLQGIPEYGDQYLGVMRCRPRDLSAMAPILPTWPNVFTAIKNDYGNQGWTCNEAQQSPEEQLYCAVKDYQDPPNPPAGSVSVALAGALDLGAQLFTPPDSVTAKTLGKRYGVYPAFSGLGFAVNGSGSLTSFNATDSLRNLVVPEYMVKNVTLQDGGCRCIIVPPYPNRDNQLLDLNWAWSRGGRGKCVEVKSLRRAQP